MIIRKSNLLPFVSLLLVIAVWCLGAVAVYAAAEPDDDTVYTEGTLYYTVKNDSITITGCFGKSEEVTVPSMIAGIPVNTIAAGAFANNTHIHKLNLPDTISRVENGAIADGIRVIYNANTDHPQETPTELILGNAETQPAESTSADATVTDADPSTDAGDDTTASESAADTTSAGEPATDPADETTQPAETAEPIGEWDVDIDETTATAEPETTADAETTTAGDTAEPTTTDTTSSDVTATLETTPPDGGKSTDPDTAGKRMPVWGWVLIGVAVVICAAGAVLAVKRKNK